MFLLLAWTLAVVPPSSASSAPMAETMETQLMEASAEVELDIYSGMPNPTWDLTSAQAASLAMQLDALPPAPVIELSGNLGYRGFIVRVTQENGIEVVHIQAGTVLISQGAASRYCRDANRALERWLLNTGKSRLKKDIADIVERDLR